MMKQTQAPRHGRPSRRVTLPALALLAALALPSAARAQWTTNGGNTVTTTPNNVGVGTTNPANGKLQVNKSIRIDDDTSSASGSDTINGAPSLYLGTAGGGGQFQYNSGGGLDLWQYNGTWRRTITFARTGFVGIGTTSPLNQFHVDGGSGSGGIRVSGWSAGMGFRDNGAGADAKMYQWRSEGGLFRMALINDAENDFVRQNILVANTAGNVGVGTAPSSTSRLHVLGGNVESQFSTTAGQGYGLFIARDNNHFVENAYLDGTVWQWRAIQTGKSAMLSTNASGGNALTVAADDTARAGGASRSYASLLTVKMDGKVGIGKTDPAHTLDVAGTINATGAITGGTISATYQDVAEWVPSTQKLMPGTVVVLDTGRTNHVQASASAYDTKVAGVISETPGVILGVGGEGKVKVATTGRVKVKVDASRGAIKVGDLLVTSGAEGVAMKSVPVDLGGTAIHRPGTIIGKALEPLEKGVGEILVLLSLQ